MQPRLSRAILLTWLAAVLPLAAFSAEEPTPDEVYQAFASPSVDCKPHTRWWWMGNALRKEDIARQLEAMAAQGIGGVEQITMEPVYTQGNHEYLSREYFDLLRYAVEQARDRGMEFSVNFGGPGWIWGGDWVPEEDRSQVMLASTALVEGPTAYSGNLPEDAVINPRDVPRSMPHIAAEDRLVKVVAARVEAGRLRADSLTDLSSRIRGRAIAWDVPPGQWQIMGFWLTQRDNAKAVNHLNQGAMSRYCETLGAQYADAIGSYFGNTVESFFSDSFEVPIYRNGLYWSDGLFEAFLEQKGYDLVPWLPALWYDVDDLSPRVRYDVNEFLHEQGVRAFFQTFLDWCARHNVRGRVQPYGFVTDIIEGAGAAHIPEIEITAGEKDAVPWFDTRIGPREYTASGAHLYGRNLVTAEAFTYLHWEPYRETLEELKIATDGYLRAGANKIYNHGFIASPERDIVPVRGFFAAIRISPENIWWPHYHNLAEYTARCCALLRQGEFVADVAVYSPLANQWTQNVLNARKWTREFDFGGLGALLMSNGYGYDLVNDDVLQHACSFDGPQLHLGKMTYRVLVLPEITAMPVESLRRIDAYVRQGGVVIALERAPEAATGMKDRDTNDAEVRRICADLFTAPTTADDGGVKNTGGGRTFSMKLVLRREDQLDWRSAPHDPFLKALRQCAAPDMEIDLVGAGRRNNEGLACIHRRAKAMDIYFVANFQDVAINEPIGFRVAQGRPWLWDPCTGERRPICSFNRAHEYTRLPLALEPFGSAFVVFDHTNDTAEPPHIVQSDFAAITEANAAGFTAVAEHNGAHAYAFFDGNTVKDGVVNITGLPAPFEIGGDWNLRFEGTGAPEDARVWQTLRSWSDDPALRYFSGTGRYAITFTLSPEYFADSTRLCLSLGVVGNIAEIRMNNRAIGTHWKRGQTFDVTGIATPGANTLEIGVTNLLINRVSGMTAFPELAPDLRPIFGAGLHATTPEAERLRGFAPLPRAGLLGPVRITPKIGTATYF